MYGLQIEKRTQVQKINNRDCVNKDLSNIGRQPNCNAATSHKNQSKAVAYQQKSDGIDLCTQSEQKMNKSLKRQCTFLPEINTSVHLTGTNSARQQSKNTSVHLAGKHFARQQRTNNQHKQKYVSIITAGNWHQWLFQSRSKCSHHIHSSACKGEFLMEEPE